MVSHFVAPKDREANFRSCGIVCKTSTIILIIIGKIMTASTIPPEKTEYPVTDRPNRGATHPPTIGTTNKTPHTPYSTGGIAARSEERRVGKEGTARWSPRQANSTRH